MVELERVVRVSSTFRTGTVYDFLWDTVSCPSYCCCQQSSSEIHFQICTNVVIMAIAASLTLI